MTPTEEERIRAQASADAQAAIAAGRGPSPETLAQAADIVRAARAAQLIRRAS